MSEVWQPDEGEWCPEHWRGEHEWESGPATFGAPPTDECTRCHTIRLVWGAA